MSEHIQLTYAPFPSVQGQKIRRWECHLNGVHVGNITYSPGRRYSAGDYSAEVYECEDPGVYNLPYRRTRTCGDYHSVYAAKVGMLEKARAYARYAQVEKARKAPAAFLPSGDYQFYPTPSALAGRLFGAVNFNMVKTVLEPSAGKGDLLDFAMQRKKTWRIGRQRRSHDGDVLECDCVEIDPNLRAILQSKGYRVVHDDFLSFATRKRYDLILMNPPFSEGGSPPDSRHRADSKRRAGRLHTECRNHSEPLQQQPEAAGEEAEGIRRFHTLCQRRLCRG